VGFQTAALLQSKTSLQLPNSQQLASATTLVIPVIRMHARVGRMRAAAKARSEL
jgi:hypothetical protein